MTFPAPVNEPQQQRRARRVVLLGAVAALALGGGFAADYTLAPHPANAQTTTAQPSGPASFADIVQRVKGAVVSVKVKMVENDQSAENDDQDNGPQLSPDDPLERFFRRFGNGPNSPFKHHPRTEQALGSGFIISSDGYVVTNNHVVENATDVTVTLDDGSTHPAKVVGTDKKTDLALLKIKDGSNYQHVEFSNKLPRVGDWVIAVGNPYGLGGTVTAGIVSARGRDIGAGPYDDFLQIDAPINRGNSGGPTFNEQGQVVGVNTAIYSPSGGSVGIGFAIPSEVASNVINALRTKGTVARGWIGVQIQPVTHEIAESLGLKSTTGALVADTQPHSPAFAAGIKSGDVITAVNGDKVSGPRELARTIAGMGPNHKAEITYLHDGQQKTADLTLGTLPADQNQKVGANTAQPEKSTLSNLGVTLEAASAVKGAGKEGVAIVAVDPDGVAASKGLRTGDVILDAGGKTVSKPADISAAFAAAKKEGRKAVLLRIKNADGTRFVALATNPAG